MAAPAAEARVLESSLPSAGKNDAEREIIFCVRVAGRAMPEWLPTEDTELEEFRCELNPLFRVFRRRQVRMENEWHPCASAVPDQREPATIY